MRINLTGVALLALAISATTMQATPAGAQTSIPAAATDIANRDVWILPTARLRFGESLLSRRYLTNGVLPLLVKGRGTCSAVACPVTFNGQNVFARRLRVSLSDPGGGSPAGTCSEVSSIDRSLRRGDTGADVEVLQRCLNTLGSSLEVDGNYGRGTREVVRDFQRQRGLEADGVVGPATRSELAKAS